MVDEQELRYRFPEIPWEQPVVIHVIGHGLGRYVCRYCIAMHGILGHEVEHSPFAYSTRREAQAHIKREHPMGSR